MARILWVSDHPALRHVGQSRVTREICLRLSINYEVLVLGFVPPQIELTEDEGFSFTTQRIVRGDVNSIDKTIKQWKPDYVVLSHDIWLFPFLPKLKQKYPNVKFIMYATIDGEPFNPRWAAIAYSCDAIFVPSKYGIGVLLDSCPDIATFYMPYGVSPDFYSRSKTREFQLGKYRVNLPEFIVTYYGHNQSKKNIGNMLLGWKEFIEGRDDCALALIVHTSEIKKDNKTIKHGYDLLLYTNTSGLIVIEDIATDDQLSTLLSSSDSLLFPSLGEGFGLPCLEAMSCGCIPIVSNYAATTDFCSEKNSILLGYTPIVGELEVIRAIVSPNDIAKALTRRYDMRGTEEEKNMIDDAYETASQFSWAKTAITFEKALQKVDSIDRQYYTKKY